MKKIIIISNTSWFVYNFFRASITDLMENGKQVYVLAPEDEYSHLLVKLGCKYRPIKVDRSGANPFQELSTIVQLFKTIYHIKPICILNFTPKMNIYGVIAGRLNGIKVINSIAGLGSIFTDKGIKSVFGKLLLSLTQPFAHHIVFQNTNDWRVYLKHKLITKAKSSHKHGIGIDLTHFKPHEAPDDGVVRFVLVARMLKTKGVHYFVEAAMLVDAYYVEKKCQGEIVPRYEFSLLGFVDAGNPQCISLSTLQEWHDNTIVNYLGETDDVYSVVKDQDCVVLPSYYREGVPQSLIEACAMAKPIITTNNVGCRETVAHNKTGYIVKKQCSESLKEAMINMIELSHDERLAFGMKGRVKAERKFCHLKIAHHYNYLINKLNE
jgi:glycosyltransferase involved in cell wall biosynthesis